jgi:hypothetical protein
MTPDLPTTAASSSAGARSMLTVNLGQQCASRVPLGHGKRLKGADRIAAASPCALRVVGAWVSFAPWDP